MYLRVASRVAEWFETSSLGNQEISGKCLNPIKWYPSAQSTHEIEAFVNTCKNLLKNRNWAVLVVHYFTWKLELDSDILWMIVVSFFDPQKDFYYAFFLFLLQEKFDIFLIVFSAFVCFFFRKSFISFACFVLESFFVFLMIAIWHFLHIGKKIIKYIFYKIQK